MIDKQKFTELQQQKNDNTTNSNFKVEPQKTQKTEKNFKKKQKSKTKDLDNKQTNLKEKKLQQNLQKLREKQEMEKQLQLKEEEELKQLKINQNKWQEFQFQQQFNNECQFQNYYDNSDTDQDQNSEIYSSFFSETNNDNINSISEVEVIEGEDNIENETDQITNENQNLQKFDKMKTHQEHCQQIGEDIFEKIRYNGNLKDCYRWSDSEQSDYDDSFVVKSDDLDQWQVKIADINDYQSFQMQYNQNQNYKPPTILQQVYNSEIYQNRLKDYKDLEFNNFSYIQQQNQRVFQQLDKNVSIKNSSTLEFKEQMYKMSCIGDQACNNQIDNNQIDNNQNFVTKIQNPNQLGKIQKLQNGENFN